MLVESSARHLPKVAEFHLILQIVCAVEQRLKLSGNPFSLFDPSLDARDRFKSVSLQDHRVLAVKSPNDKKLHCWAMEKKRTRE